MGPPRILLESSECVVLYLIDRSFYDSSANVHNENEIDKKLKE